MIKSSYSKSLYIYSIYILIWTMICGPFYPVRDSIPWTKVGELLRKNFILAYVYFY